MRYLIIITLLMAACKPATVIDEALASDVELIVLGTVQDGGSPHIGCKKPCCTHLFDSPDPTRMVVSLGLIDHRTHTTYLFDATPDIPRQIKMLKQAGDSLPEIPTGVFLTHAHIGHYGGLMYFGRESAGTRNVPVHVMPRMADFIQNNEPWKQLLTLNNIRLESLENDSTITIGDSLTVTPILVPHRDELSETVGFRIVGPNKRILFIPDIDKWSKWDRDLVEELKNVDHALIDATFFDGEEIQHRDISEIPHPFVIETMELLSELPVGEQEKVIFIHMNHTNPLLNEGSHQSEYMRARPYQVARTGMRLEL